MNTFFTSLIRTLVPLLIGWLTSLAVSVGVDLPESAWQGLEATITLAAAAGYYTVVRALEQKFPGIGWFLGVAKQPNYSGRGITEEEVRKLMEAAAAAERDDTPPEAGWDPEHRA